MTTDSIDPAARQDVVVIGAGPAGLATAAALKQVGVDALIVDRGEQVGTSWRGHYDRLHLHTVRWLSDLPGLRIPAGEGRWVSRDGVVRYLEHYAEHHQLTVRTGVEVTAMDRRDDAWRVRSPQGDLTAHQVVIATGYNHTPYVPDWPGRDGFEGQWSHAARYRNGRPYSGRDVLVVGAGNAGAEIGVDLAEHRAGRVRLAFRTPPHVLRRELRGIPIQATAVVLRRVPAGVADALIEPLRRHVTPDLTEHGLPEPGKGIYTRAKRGEIPILDVGLIEAVRSGLVEPVPEVEGFDGPRVLLAGRASIEPEAVIAATGYKCGLESLVGQLGLLDERGVPRVHGDRTAPQAAGLRFIGYTNPISGMLREIATDARRIARAIRRELPPSRARADPAVTTLERDDEAGPGTQIDTPRGPETGREGLTRRALVGGAAGTALAAVLPAESAAAARRHAKHAASAGSVRHADAVVVGAGVAGLTAARSIAAAGRSVIVLEARDRVGGRTWNHDIGGGRVAERGAMCVGPTQDHILALLRELGVGTFPTYDTGQNVYVADGSRSTYSDSGPLGTAPPDPTTLAEVTTTVLELDQMSTSVPVDAPWEASNAAQWDGQTLETFLNAHSLTPRYHELVGVATRPIFGAEPRELSLLFVLFYIASSGNETTPGTFERNFDTRNGAQMWRLVGGSQVIAQKIAQDLGSHVVLGSPARRISQGPAGVTVHSDRVTVKAKQVIVATPPTLAGRIDYEPLLPFERDQLTQRFAQGTLTKVAAVYDRPFWRDAGLTGAAVDTGTPISVTFDGSPPDGSAGVVFGFVGGDNARAFNTMSPSARQAAVLNQYATFFGPQAKNARAYFETSWSAERWTRGCPVGIPSTGTLLAYGSRIRQPVGRIHWAGTETSTYWNGYMEGAVRSGERAATELLAEL
jgi:monoamine oxidase